MTFDGNNLVLPATFLGGFPGQAVGTHTELVLLLTGDAVHLAQHFRGQAHHVGGLGGDLGDLRVDVHTVIHGHVTHVLHTTDDEHVAVAGLDGLGGGVQRLHGRATQTVHGLGSAGARQAGQHGDVTGDVHALFFGLVYTAPDHIFGLLDVPVGVTLHERFHQQGRQFFGTHVTELAITALAHGSTDRIDDNYVIGIQAHFYNSCQSVA